MRLVVSAKKSNVDVNWSAFYVSGGTHVTGCL